MSLFKDRRSKYYTEALAEEYGDCPPIVRIINQYFQVETKKIKAAERSRRWRLANPEWAKRLCREAYQRNKVEWNRRSREWARANREKCRERSRKWRLANPEKAKALIKDWGRRNPEKVKANYKRYCQKHPERRAECHARYMARIRNAPVVERIDRISIAARDGWKCYLCGIELTRSTLALDHRVAVSKGGEHSARNLAACCRSCNSRKGNRWST